MDKNNINYLKYKSQIEDIPYEVDLLADLYRYAKERYQISLNKRNGMAFPWSADPVFKNHLLEVFREDNRGSVECYRRVATKTFFANKIKEIFNYRFRAEETAYLIFRPAPFLDWEINKCINIIMDNPKATIDDLIKLFNIATNRNDDFAFLQVLQDIGYLYPQLIDLDSDLHIGIGSRPMIEKIQQQYHCRSLNETVRMIQREQVKYWPDAPRKLTFTDIEDLACELRKYWGFKLGTKPSKEYIPNKVIKG